MQLSPPLIAVATGIIGSAWVSGAISSFSIAGAPAAAAVPQTSARVWAQLYRRGVATMPKYAGVVALSYLYAAYDAYTRDGPWRILLAAAACVVSTVPFTFVAMKKTNDALHEAAVVEATQDKNVMAAQVPQLLQTWTRLNSIRGLFPLAGTILGSVAFLGGQL
ncbi:Anthrone oxygenase ptaC [Cladobotryum mycophilum]|uniref:Anthrone oxygenase ptaC n=1 Tax=Cladobotryum mycophilum TaxID=491253 RepID=A0ABR0T3P7_9HYPO